MLQSKQMNKLKAAVATATLANIIIIRRRRRRRQKVKRNINRTLWIRNWLNVRKEKGAYANLLQELSNEDPKALKNFLRMDLQSFHELASLVCPLIKKQDTVMRLAIPAEERLAVTLRYLASGNTYQDLEYLYRISRQSLSEIIPETCAAIKEALSGLVLKCPTTTEEWAKIAKGFGNRWNFPNCLGAVDGKHIKIKKPDDTGSMFFNYKGYFSIILLAIVSFDYKFLFVDIGRNGRENDSGIYQSSTFREALDAGLLNIPQPMALPGRESPIPHVIVGDDAFALKTNLMKGYSGRDISHDEKIFNYRMSRARRVVENSFGILANRFRVLLTTIALSPGNTTTVVWACICLHNYLRNKSSTMYMPRELIDHEDHDFGLTPGTWRDNSELESLDHQGSNNYTKDARKVRNEFKDYFVSEVGSVPWQDRMI